MDSQWLAVMTMTAALSFTSLNASAGGNGMHGTLVVAQLASKKYPPEPYRFQEGDLVVKNCTSGTSKVEVYDQRDTNFRAPKTSALISPGQVSRKLACDGICGLRSGTLAEQRVRSGHYVIISDSDNAKFTLRPTNSDAQSRNCDIYEY